MRMCASKKSGALPSLATTVAWTLSKQLVQSTHFKHFAHNSRDEETDPTIKIRRSVPLSQDILQVDFDDGY